MGWGKKKPNRAKDCHCSNYGTVQRITYQDFKSSEQPSKAKEDFIKPPEPPPYGREDLWELQFCRWWGWNWVRKREEEAICTKCPSKNTKENPKTSCPPNIQRQSAPVPASHRTKIIESHPRSHSQHRKSKPGSHGCCPQSKKKRVKEFCECFLKSKRAEHMPPPEMRRMYETPSNSVVLCERYACGLLDPTNDTFEEINVSRSVSKQSRREVEKRNQKQVQSWTTETNLSSEEEIAIEICCCAAGRNAGNEDYINARMEQLKVPPEVEVPKKDVEVETKSTNVQKIEMADEYTQTSRLYLDVADKQTGSYKQPKMRKIRVVSCCCCDPNKKLGNAPGCYQVKDQINTDHRTSLSHENPKPKTSLEYPADNTFAFFAPSVKHFSKFGKPSQNYPWLHTSLSENISARSWTSEEFRSPISGRVYNIDPLKLNSVKAEGGKKLPDLIDISDNLNYLKMIESNTKTDIEKRVMMDALCEAILSENQNEYRKRSSTFLNEFKPHILDPIGSLHSIHTPSSDKMMHNNDFTHQFSNQSKYQKENTLDNIKNTYCFSDRDRFSEKRSVSTDNDISRFSTKSCKTSNLELRINDHIPTRAECNLLCTSEDTVERPSFTRTGLMTTVPSKTNKAPKRSRSPTVEPAAKKKVKQEPVTIIESDTNMEDIFQKIHELVEKSKISNNEIMENLLFDGAPKKTYLISPIGNFVNSQSQHLSPVESITSVKNETLAQEKKTTKSEKALTHISFMVCDTKSGRVADENRKASENDNRKSLMRNTSVGTSRASLIPVRKYHYVRNKTFHHKK